MAMIMVLGALSSTLALSMSMLMARGLATQPSAPRPRLGVLSGVEGGTVGAQLIEVTPGTPAAAAGLRVGDVILAVDGHLIDAPTELRRQLWAQPPGASPSLLVQRGAQTFEVSPTLLNP